MSLPVNGVGDTEVDVDGNVTLAAGGSGGFVFDYYSATDFKYVALDAAAEQVVVGHLIKGQWVDRRRLRGDARRRRRLQGRDHAQRHRRDRLAQRRPARLVLLLRRGRRRRHRHDQPDRHDVVRQPARGHRLARRHLARQHAADDHDAGRTSRARPTPGKATAVVSDATLGTATRDRQRRRPVARPLGRPGRQRLPDRHRRRSRGRRPTSSATRPSKTQKVTVVDTEKPVLTVPRRVIAVRSPGTRPRRRSPTRSSARRRRPTTPASVTVVRSGVPAGNVFPVGTTTITYTATDAAGNVTTLHADGHGDAAGAGGLGDRDRRERQRVPARPDRASRSRAP